MRAVAPPAGEAMPAPPKIEIASRVFQGGTERVKGFFEGTDLKSAGIFDGDTKSKDIDVASTPGEQRINFDFSIEQPSPTQSIRVADVYGREAQALVSPDPAAIGPMKGSEEMIEVDPGASASSRGEAGPLAESPLASAGPSRGNNTAEIARPGDELSPSRRHIDANSSLGPLTNVQINVIDAEESMAAPGNVEVIGQIAGAGVRHAGVYVNGRLVKPIPISTGGYSAFDLTFPMPAGSDARIRAYGNGNDFVEASIDTVGGGNGHDRIQQSADVSGAVRSLPCVSAVAVLPAQSVRLRESVCAWLQSVRAEIRIRMDTRRRTARRRRRGRGTANCSTSAHLQIQCHLQPG